MANFLDKILGRGGKETVGSDIDPQTGNFITKTANPAEQTPSPGQVAADSAAVAQRLDGAEAAARGQYLGDIEGSGTVDAAKYQEAGSEARRIETEKIKLEQELEQGMMQNLQADSASLPEQSPISQPDSILEPTVIAHVETTPAAEDAPDQPAQSSPTEVAAQISTPDMIITPATDVLPTEQEPAQTAPDSLFPDQATTTTVEDGLTPSTEQRPAA